MSLEPLRSPRASLGQTSALALLIAAGVAVGGADALAAAAASDDDKAPTLIEARTLSSDDERGLVVAAGDVEVSKGHRTVRADKITYNKKTKVVVAEGNVRVVEPSGDIMFAEYAELTDDLKSAFVENVGMLLVDNSRLAGNEGEKQPDGTIRISRGVYSPCDLCAEDPSAPPVWSLRGVRIVQDKEKRDVYYRDATLEFLGLPIAYTPYFSHPDPSVKRRSGLLMPTWGHRSTGGTFVSAGYYFDISPDRDATVRVTPFTSGAFMLSGEYRERFSNGAITFNFDAARADLISESDKTSKGVTFRGFASLAGRFNLTDEWRAGFNLDRVTDRTFIKQYLSGENSARDLLTSRAYAEGFNDRDYASVNLYAFQDLRYGYSRTAPVAMPKVDWNAVGDPGSLLGGRWQLDVGSLNLSRQQAGARSIRASIVPGWSGRYFVGGGLVADLRAQAWLISKGTANFDDPRTVIVERRQGSEYIALPETDLTLRWPFARSSGGWAETIEPIVQFKTSPDWTNTFKTKNEDALDVELDETTLFLPSRYSGLDRLEGGTRVTYGLRGRAAGSGLNVAGFLGQSYALSGAGDYMSGSGLEKRASDVVGRVSGGVGTWMGADYGFRYSPTTGRLGRQSASAWAGVPEVRVFSGYTTLGKRQDADGNQLAAIDQISGGFQGKINKYWSYTLSQSYNLVGSPAPMTSSGVLVYKDECFTFQSTLTRNYSSVSANTDPGVTAYFQLTFKNLGQIGFSSTVGSSSSSSTSTQ